MEISDFEGPKIQHLPELGVFRGDFEIGIANGNDTVNRVRMTVFAAQTEASTFADLEATLFAAASDHLARLSSLFAGHSCASLRQTVEESRARREAENRAEIDATLGSSKS